ncbi:hypothetical protein AWZ03_002493 [Drosophila navojoa]|uniref:Saposin B-type domain-containing protein n=1 Tax=Drosophila navojoa TaxID=7232 RepID=A0A484BSR3_DRONA|nr:hypothetical protein AWZ03_002493 [Drosophila navojoa]
MELCNSEQSKNDFDFVTDEDQLFDFTENAPHSPQCLACVRSHISNEKLKSAMNKACNKLGKIATKCQKVVNSHGDQLARFARNPTVLCSLLAMCSPIAQDQEEYVEYEAYEEEETLTDIALQPSKCAICKAAMRALQHMVRHHTDKGEVARALAHVCHKLGKLQHECEHIINEHGAQIIDQMIKHTPVQMICKAIHVCRSGGILEVDFVGADDLEML